MLEETKNKALLSEPSFAEIHNPNTDLYGLGHIITKHNEEIAHIGHTGLGMGWNASFQFIPNSETGIIVLTNGENGIYIHATLTCYWYFLQTGKRLQSSKSAPNKKLNRIELYLEISNEKGLINSSKYDKYVIWLSNYRKKLKQDKFDEFVKELSNLRTELKVTIKNSEIQLKLEETFHSIFYWMNMPWFR